MLKRILIVVVAVVAVVATGDLPPGIFPERR